MNQIQEDQIREQVRSRYGQIATMEKTSCCAPSCCGGTTGGAAPETLGYESTDVSSVPEGAEMGLGCGNPLALASIQPGETVIDLGSGGGFDCFLAAQRTGSTGRVIGVDMTPEMLSKARANAEQGGFGNVEFRLGEIENLPLADSAADLVISNCVVNLSPNKARVLGEVFRVLKPGGRVAISDIVATAPLPPELQEDFAAYTGCVAGASTPGHLEEMLRSAGFETIAVTVNEASRQFINEWAPGKEAGRYVASASIQARKPVRRTAG